MGINSIILHIRLYTGYSIKADNLSCI